MIKTIFPLFLLTLVLLQNVNLTFIKAHFDFNRDYIAKNLCINRFNPESNCNGQCYLMKKLSAEAEKEAENKAIFSPVLSFSFYQNEIDEILFTPFNENLKTPHFSDKKYLLKKDPYLERH